MDPNVSYYTVGQFGMRMWSRYLMQYPSVEGKTTQISPDLAVAPPKVTNGGLVYSFTIRKGAQWDTTPPRQVTAADAVLGLKRSCNPVKPSAALADYEFLVAGLQQFCDAFAKVKPKVGAIAAFIKSHNISGVSVSPKDPLTVVYRLTHPASYFPALMGLGGVRPGAGRVPEVPADQLAARPEHDLGRAVQDRVVQPGQEHRLRPQPGVEGLERPAPPCLRRRDQGRRDGAAGLGAAAAADEHADGERRVG